MKVNSLSLKMKKFYMYFFIICESIDLIYVIVCVGCGNIILVKFGIFLDIDWLFIDNKFVK